uniref:Uncharacterized protein n=1 Tax=Thermococcus sp. IRI48 TaxID=1197734 RepID=L0B9K0_9EURY|nr:hypothetical protein [Thermococcus sp. IRI48]AFZ84238.1 hypothetical protein i48-12 [Thermococcus sp. IRI48]
MRDNVAPLKKDFDFLSKEELEELYVGLLRNLPKFKEKWDVVRFVYEFVTKKHGESVATKVAWRITKHFDTLFEKGKFVDFYLPTEAGVRLFEELIHHTEPMEPVPKQGVQLHLTAFFNISRGVSV